MYVDPDEWNVELHKIILRHHPMYSSMSSATFIDSSECSIQIL
jgi:hypothetical protein